MHIRIGDIVRFISEKLEGKVTGLIDQNTVNVYCEEYGFEIPASLNDLVVIQSDFNTDTDLKVRPQTTVVTASTDSLYLALVPENFQNLPESRYEIYLINDTGLTCLYAAGTYNGESYSALSAGNCNPDTALSLGLYSRKELDRIKAFHIQAIFYQKGKYSPRQTVDVHIRLSQTSLCKTGSYQHTKWFENMAFVRPLDKESPLQKELEETDITQALKEKKESTSAPKPQKQIVNNIIEIDLHINELLETTTGMENKDILDYQLDVFHKTLEKYKLRKGQKIVFIHGKGDGVLRQRILWELQTKYKRFRHQDASFKQYGYGATMVIIK